jgi:subtilisin family serine protease
MAASAGSADVTVALLDGPVATDHPELAEAHIRGPHDAVHGSGHGTFVAGILVARRGSGAPAICPACTLLVRPIFSDDVGGGRLPAASPDELAAAIVECVDARARVVNLSAATGHPSTREERGLHESLDYAASCGTLIVAAAGNQGTLGSSAITRHPWVIPVVGYDRRARPLAESNLGSSLARRGVGAPGEGIRSIGAPGSPLALRGTSFAAPFVTGTIALLASLFPWANGAEIRRAVTHRARRSTSVAPPLLDAAAALATLGARVAEVRALG